MKITRAIIDSGKSERGGWSAAQLQVLGVKWPPKQGWPARIIGTEISAKDYERFLELRNYRRKQKIGPPHRPPSEHPELFTESTAEDFANEIFRDTGGNLSGLG